MSKSLKKLYGNCSVYNKNKELIFRCDEKRAKWYLDRKLAEKLSDDPTTIRLLFETKGPGNKDKPFYLEDKKNICVVCGSDKDLNKHHVVPISIKKYFPDSVKNRNCYDIVLLCILCHELYEHEYALELKKELSKIINYSIHGETTAKVDNEKRKLKSAAITLLENRHTMPKHRIDFFEEIIKSNLGLFTFSDEDLEKIISEKDHSWDGYKTFGELLVNNMDIPKIIFTWRSHFLEKMKPKFLPESWLSLQKEIKKG